MPTRARKALAGAAIGVLLLVLIWYAAHYVGVVKRADASILSGFLQLDRPHVDRFTSFIAELCNPDPYVILVAAPVILALVRGRPRVAVVLVLILLGANETAQLLKPLLAAPHDATAHRIAEASWPSGHATAAMSLCMCWIIAAPSRLRPAVGAVMAAFSIAVSYSFLELGWHYPSDVLGGFLVAGVWTLLGSAALSTYEARRPALATRSRSPSFSLGEALAPTAVILAAAAALAGVIALARPSQVIDYTRVHEAFVIGAVVIAALGFTLASGLTLMLRRPASELPPAPQR